MHGQKSFTIFVLEIHLKYQVTNWWLKNLLMWSNKEADFFSLKSTKVSLSLEWAPNVCEMHKLNRLLWSFSNRNCTFSVEFWVRAPLKSCSKVVRLTLYVGIFQFYCTWKTENCRIFWPNQRVVYKILRWAALAWLVEKNSTWPHENMISEVFRIWFEKVYTALSRDFGLRYIASVKCCPNIMLMDHGPGLLHIVWKK